MVLNIVPSHIYVHGHGVLGRLIAMPSFFIASCYPRHGNVVVVTPLTASWRLSSPPLHYFSSSEPTKTRKRRRLLLLLFTMHESNISWIIVLQGSLMNLGASTSHRRAEISLSRRHSHCIVKMHTLMSSTPDLPYQT